MNKSRFLSGLLGLILANTALADLGVGTVLAYDREAQLLVLNDRSTWSLQAMGDSVPGKLSAGDRVQYRFESDESEVGYIVELNVMREITAGGAERAIDGTVFAFDREAQLLVLDDRTIWPLDNLDSALPLIISAGNRVRIEYKEDPQGITSVDDIRVIEY